MRSLDIVRGSGDDPVATSARREQSVATILSDSNRAFERASPLDLLYWDIELEK
jgi:hypothetical protein